ncbi:MAG TPA: Smr/MutS family protein [Croceibacterium sp.]|nr:Smr/MutS family protein [Croceibacterium sp.]
MKPPRGLSAGEAALWRRVTETVTPLSPLPLAGGAAGGPVSPGTASDTPSPSPSHKREGDKPRPAAAPAPRTDAGPGLDASWERKLARAALEPDFTLDLHGHTLDQAHARLDAGLAQARAMGARLVLLVTGKPRPVDAADRGARRGAIRAKVLDWLAAGPHAGDIAAIRQAHRRHGGDGALYLVLKRARPRGP